MSETSGNQATGRSNSTVHISLDGEISIRKIETFSFKIPHSNILYVRSVRLVLLLLFNIGLVSLLVKRHFVAQSY